MGTVRTPMRRPVALSATRACTSPCLSTARFKLARLLEPSARRTLTLSGSSSRPRSRPATSSAVASGGMARPSMLSKTSPTRSPAPSAGPPATTLTISTDSALTLRTVTPMPPLSAGRSYFASSDA
eukprot:3167301-Prymnesium_polylepis.2